MVKHVIRPPWVSEVRGDVVLRPGTPTQERWRSLQLVWIRDVTIQVALEMAEGDGGVLVSHGSQGGGYVLFVEDGELIWSHNDGRSNLRVSGGEVPAGVTEIRADLSTKPGYRWALELSIDGEGVGGADDLAGFVAMAPFEGITVGRDPRSPVDWDVSERHGSFPWTGRLESVTYRPGPFAADSPESMIDVARQVGAAFE